MDFDFTAFWTKYEAVLLVIGAKILAGVFILVVGFWLIGWMARQLGHLLQKRQIDISVAGFLTSFFSVGLKILLVLSIAGMFGVETTSFIAILSALSLAVGLALQGNLGHFASGILLLSFRPFRVGDFVTADGYSGTVKEIQVFHTILTTLDNRLIIIPNGKVMGNAIENMTAQGFRRADFTFGIGYGDDIDKARAVIAEVINATPGILLEMNYDILVKKLNDSSVDFAVRFWTDNANYWPVFFHFTEHVKKAFDAAGIGIPFPQMDVHLKSAPPPPKELGV
ncbi:mechanosensitive ion channel [Neolewinella lacunae]|uniref:Mechanosensitive ion channel n=1 Tax=Neolewinella lacunae TaxID=1517758 RepID=A0A923PNQ5_9BACT|nr:mechanosensitive ion channel domain-containing protein [Neolewinella lacunae]MBC6996081.1 mechanosensitive ion channel [Neolewinella lacunae]MDN3633934.1 mechanosensitive ion channel [Neolewinella lacunae]